MTDIEKQEIIRAERKRILDRWIEIHEVGNWTKACAADLTIHELAKQENYPPYDKKI